MREAIPGWGCLTPDGMYGHDYGVFLALGRRKEMAVICETDILGPELTETRQLLAKASLEVEGLQCDCEALRRECTGLRTECGRLQGRSAAADIGGRNEERARIRGVVARILGAYSEEIFADSCTARGIRYVLGLVTAELGPEKTPPYIAPSERI